MKKKYKLPLGEYPEDFIKYLAMCVHLKLIEPAELTFLLESGISIDRISFVLAKKIIENRGNR